MRAIHNERLPAAIVDLDAFDRNVKNTTQQVLASQKKLRLATKSLRVPALIHRALEVGGDAMKGLMCFSAEEALALWQYARQKGWSGFDDFLIAYPTLQPSDLQALRKLHESGAKVALVIDCREQIQALAQVMKGVQRPFSVVIDVDASLRIWGKLHLGVRRSRVRTSQDALALCEQVAQHSLSLQSVGLMAYEAQIAGLTDRNPFKRLLNPIAKLIRRASVPYVARLRAEIASAMKKGGFRTDLVNGGGSGSLDFALAEKSLTEVSLGSGFLCPHLFDYYSNIRFEPALFFALQAVRSSDPGYVTCQGGGYIASGEPGWDRVPIPDSPRGLKLVSTEGAGEVQTPLLLPNGTQIPLGSPVLFRHAKAGELAERFNEYLWVSNDTIVERTPTYRGLGWCFF